MLGNKEKSEPWGVSWVERSRTIREIGSLAGARAGGMLKVQVRQVVGI